MGILLAGPVSLKLGATGYRFARYYSGHRAYRCKGAPKLSLASTGGTLSGDPTFRNNLEQERKKDQNDVSWANVYPVVALGLAYKF